MIHPVGVVTGIDYLNDFYQYVDQLERQSKKAPIRELFKCWDKYLFGVQVPKRRGGGTGDDVDSSLAQIQDELDALPDIDSDVEVDTSTI